MDLLSWKPPVIGYDFNARSLLSDVLSSSRVLRSLSTIATPAFSRTDHLVWPCYRITSSFSMADVSVPLSHEDSLGLTLVYEPDGVLPYLDIVLVHALGRTSASTWAQEGSLSSFWPGWLHDEGPLRMARVWTAGYSASDLRENLLHKTRHAIDRFVGCLWNGLARGVSATCTRKLIDSRDRPVFVGCLARDADSGHFCGTLHRRHCRKAGQMI